jgi:hypothetical protein
MNNHFFLSLSLSPRTPHSYLPHVHHQYHRRDRLHLVSLLDLCVLPSAKSSPSCKFFFFFLVFFPPPQNIYTIYMCVLLINQLVLLSYLTTIDLQNRYHWLHVNAKVFGPVKSIHRKGAETYNFWTATAEHLSQVNIFSCFFFKAC